MGNFYMTATIADAPQVAIIAEVRDLKAFVGPSQGRFTVVYPEIMQFGSTALQNFWANVSKALNATILVSSVYDDDVLYFELWKSGSLVDQYVSDPSAMGDEEQDGTPQGGDVEQLCATFVCSDRARVKDILSTPGTGHRYVFETDRHRELAESLGLPSSSVGFGFEYIQQGEIPPGTAASQFVKVGSE